MGKNQERASDWAAGGYMHSKKIFVNIFDQKMLRKYIYTVSKELELVGN